MTIGVKIQDLSWQFDEVKVLEELNLMIQPGHFTGIIGPNGSGKTTLLRNITASLHPRKNSVFIGEEDVLSLHARNLAKKMALVPQNTQISFAFTVEDIVMMGRHPYLGRFQQEGADDVRIVHEAMELTGVLSFRDRLVTQLSGGERQRVIIARALAQQSSIMLLDEPISNLDIKHQVEILGLVKQLVKERELTVICVLHDLNLAAHYCDQIVLLHQGRIYRQGTPWEVLNSKTIEEVYGVSVITIPNPQTGMPYILPHFL